MRNSLGFVPVWLLEPPNCGQSTKGDAGGGGGGGGGGAEGGGEGGGAGGGGGGGGTECRGAVTTIDVRSEPARPQPTLIGQRPGGVPRPIFHVQETRPFRGRLRRRAGAWERRPL
jgi:hypothetical protein